MAVDGVYGAAAREVFELFDAHLEGDPSRPALVIGSNGVGEKSRDALVKSLIAFGYSEEPCTFTSLNPIAPSASVPIDPQALFLLIEGIDPLFVITVDAQAGETLSRAYSETVPPDAAIRVFGRPSVSFANLESLLQTTDGKQRAWKLLKSLQVKR